LVHVIRLPRYRFNGDRYELIAGKGQNRPNGRERSDVKLVVVTPVEGVEILDKGIEQVNGLIALQACRD
jgi:hypothetical protein